MGAGCNTVVVQWHVGGGTDQVTIAEQLGSRVKQGGQRHIYVRGLPRTVRGMAKYC